jgi:hypothetical protein
VFQRVGLEDFREWLKGLSQSREAGAWQCHYCRGLVTAQGLTLDHKTPASEGGLTDLGNLVPSCVPCNLLKGDMGESDYLRLAEALRGMTPRGRASVSRRLKSREQRGWNKAR